MNTFQNDNRIKREFCTLGPFLRGRSKKTKIGFKTNYCFMQVKSVSEHSAILLTFIKLPFVVMIFVLSILEWPF